MRVLSSIYGHAYLYAVNVKPQCNSIIREYSFQSYIAASTSFYLASKKHNMRIVALLNVGFPGLMCAS